MHLRRPRHARDDAHRHRPVAGVDGLRADGAREHRRQHEPDVGDGRRRVRLDRHAAAGRRTARWFVRASPSLLTGTDRRRGRARRLQARREDHDRSCWSSCWCASSSSRSRACSTGTRGRRSRTDWSRRFPRTCRWSAPSACAKAFTQIMAIAGQALPPAVFLTYGYLAANAGYTAADIKRAFWKTVHEPRRDLGPVLGRRDRRRRHGAAQRLHRQRPRRTSASATTRRSKAFPSPARCSAGVPGRAGIPRAAVFLAGADRRGIHDADLGLADDDLSLPGHRAARTGTSPTTTRCSRSCSRCGSPCPRWLRRSGSCRRC